MLTNVPRPLQGSHPRQDVHPDFAPGILSARGQGQAPHRGQSLQGFREVTFVGDRGMLKSAQIEQLAKEGFHYITAITKPQIDVLLKAGVFQMELFDESLAEVIEETIRYV